MYCVFFSLSRRFQFSSFVSRYRNMADLDERSLLLGHGEGGQPQQDHSSNSITKDPEARVEEGKMANTAVGERLKYNDYTTIDWLHDLVTYSQRNAHETRETGSQ
jgi:hypothetical protein